MEEARAWLFEHARDLSVPRFNNYGETVNWGYVTARYQILENEVICELDTSKLGKLRVAVTEDVLVEYRQDRILIHCFKLRLDDSLIMHHVVAVRRVLKLIGEFADVNLYVPDISVYLALTKYSGKDYNVKGAQREINARLGSVAITVEPVTNLGG